MKRLIVASLIFVLCSVIAVLSYSQGPIPGTWLYDQNENKVDDRIETLAEQSPDSLIGMIVDFRHPPSELDVDFLRNFGEVDYVMQYIPSIAIRRVQAEVASTIAENMEVVMVELDKMVQASLDVSTRAIRARASNVYPNSAWGAGFRGQGINIAILDTGVDDGHPALNDMDDNPSTNDPKYVAGYDATANPRVATNPDDDNTHYWTGWNCVKSDDFHGTHVACIAMGTAAGTDSVGVAPEAKLIDVKVLDSCGRGLPSDIIAGIDWCITNRNKAWSGQSSAHHGIDIINMSLSGADDDGQDAMSRAVNKAVEMGLVVVVAVGNNGKTNYISTPSAADKAISVGAVDDQATINRTDDIMASFSNRGPRQNDGDSDQIDELKPDVVAYGVDINSAEGVNPNQNGTGYHELDGTSQATPHVSGVCALILEAHPQFQPHDVKNMLRTTAEDRNGASFPALDQHYDVDFGWGIVDAHAAVTTLGAPPDLWISRKPVWWLSKDIWLAKPPVAGQSNTIYAQINNTSGTAASGVIVNFRAGIAGSGMYKWLWQTNTTISVPGTGSTIASVPWTPTSAFLVKGPDHPCIRAEIIYAQDPNISNNMAQKNIAVQGGTSASTFTFRAWNPFNTPKKAFFGLDKLDLPDGWNAFLTPDGLFDLNEADSLDMMVEVFPSRWAVPGDSGIVHVAEFFQGTIAPAGGVSFKLFVEPAPAKIALPDTFGAYMDTLLVPILVSTDSAIGLAQFVVDYNGDVAQYIGAHLGSDAPGFSMLDNPEPPFPPSTFPEINKNLLVQISGAGTRFFTGQNKQVVLLSFVVIDTLIGAMTPLIFDRGIERTFLTTENLHDMAGDELAIFDGRLLFYPPGWPVIVFVRYDLIIEPPKPVPGVGVMLTHTEGIMYDTTGGEGFCVFPEVPEGEADISLSKSGDHRGAITGADALLTLRYLAFLEQLSDPQMIAADVTRDTLLTGADALAILRHLAFFTTGIAHTGSWEFVAGTPVPIPIPWPRPDEPVEFNAYLLGDVTLDWGEGLNASIMSEHSVNNLLKDTSKSEVSLSLGEVDGIAGEQILVPVNIQTNGNTANTLIFTVKYDPSCLEYQSTLKTELSEHFIMVANGTEKGKIYIAMAGVHGLQKSGNVLQLAFKVIEKIAKKHTDLTFSRAFVNDLVVIDCNNGQISFAKSGTEVPKTFQLAQNYPNPFNAETIIRYGIPNCKDQHVHVTLNIYNINGQLVRTLVDEKKAPGHHSVNWDGTDHQHRQIVSGIYFYQIQAGEFKSYKKMAVLK